jgi:hypothetical protein
MVNKDITLKLNEKNINTDISSKADCPAVIVIGMNDASIICNYLKIVHQAPGMILVAGDIQPDDAPELGIPLIDCISLIAEETACGAFIDDTKGLFEIRRRDYSRRSYSKNRTYQHNPNRQTRYNNKDNI